MNRTAVALATVALALAAGGCARQASATPVPSAAAPVEGKPSAPVSIDAQLSGSTAHVTVRFDADAKGARVHVHGTDGLAVTSAAEPVAKDSFARGDTAAFDVSFTPGPGRSY